MVRSTLILAAQIALWAVLSPAAAQTLAPGSDSSATALDGNALDALARQKRIAVTGTLGFPPLPVITADSPRNSVLYADRLPYGAPAGGGTISATVSSTWVTNTGTGFDELIDFQLPDGYDGQGAPHPMVIAYHGYGASAASVAVQSTIDERANAQNWVYLSVTGLDDQIFGTPLSQQNVDAAIEYMLFNFNVDPDRLYMVGFSAGAAICANYASQHRDPDDLMIAALGIVSATGDWVMGYTLGDAALQTWMENPFNFSGPPSTHLFNYQSASTMYNAQGSYPPVTSALPVLLESMATNLGSVPTYITYDDQDTLTHVPVLCEQLASTLLAAGGTVLKTVVSGTTLPGPPSVPAPHSWEVLDEVALFDFFNGVSVDRFPAEFSAQQVVGGPVSWISTVEERNDQFVHVDATVSPALKLITISSAINVEELHLDVTAAGLTGAMPYRIQVTNLSQGPIRLFLTGFPDSPSYMKVPIVGSLVTLVDSAPLTGPTGNGTLMVDVAGQTTFDAKVIHEPLWTTTLTTTPNPVAINSPIVFDIDGPAGDTSAYIVVSLVELLTPVNNITMTAFPGAPAIVRLLPLDAAGDISFGQTIPNDPIIVGVRFANQVVTTDAAGGLQSVSNHWGLYIAP